MGQHPLHVIKTSVANNSEAAAVMITKRGGTRVSQRKRKRCRPKGSWGRFKHRGQNQSAAFKPTGSTGLLHPTDAQDPLAAPLAAIPGSPPGTHFEPRPGKPLGSLPAPHPGSRPGTNPLPNPGDPFGSPPVAAPSQPSGSPYDSPPTAAPRKHGRPLGQQEQQTKCQQSSAYRCWPPSRRKLRRTSTAAEPSISTCLSESWDLLP